MRRVLNAVDYIEQWSADDLAARAGSQTIPSFMALVVPGERNGASQTCVPRPVRRRQCLGSGWEPQASRVGLWQLHS